MHQINHLPPERMTPEQRRHEIASLLGVPRELEVIFWLLGLRGGRNVKISMWLEWA